MTAPRPDAQLLTIPETGKRLRRSADYVYRLIAKGELEVTDIALPGARRSASRISEDKLADWIASRTRRASA